MDVSNNAAGASIGYLSYAEGGSDTWGWILAACEDAARGYRMYGPDGAQGAY